MESPYAIRFFDALRAKVRDEGLVPNKAVNLDQRHVLLGGHK